MDFAIDSFNEQFFFLSNFFPSSITIDGATFPTVEHAYQANKTIDSVLFLEIATAPTAGKAKRLGQKVQLRPDWEEIKLSLMEKCLREKFGDPQLKKKLFDTFPAELIEGNNWGDKFWGVCDGEGENHLGKLLMKIRDEELFSA